MGAVWSDKPEDLLAAGFAIPGFYRASDHVGSTGVLLPRYFDCDLLFRDPALCRWAVETLTEKVTAVSEKGRVDYLGFLEKRANTTGALTLAGALTLSTGIAHLVIRLRKDIPHERIKFPKEAGPSPLADSNVVIITDYATTGQELQPAVTAVTHLGGTVSNVIVLVWDEQQFNKRGEMREVNIADDALTLVFRASEAEQRAKEAKKAFGSIFALP